MNPAVIRYYQESDYAHVKDMIFALYEDDPTMSEAKILSTIQRSITHPEAIQIHVFESNDRIAGYAILTSFWSNEYHGLVNILDELYIQPSYRNQGISTQFISQLSQRKNHSTILLEVLKYNSKALALYQRLGFEIVDRYFMIKRLQ